MSKMLVLINKDMNKKIIAEGVARASISAWMSNLYDLEEFSSYPTKEGFMIDKEPFQSWIKEGKKIKAIKADSIKIARVINAMLICYKGIFVKEFTDEDEIVCVVSGIFSDEQIKEIEGAIK